MSLPGATQYCLHVCLGPCIPGGAEGPLALKLRFLMQWVLNRWVGEFRGAPDDSEVTICLIPQKGK